MSISIVAGLGNPGAAYEGTRHNVGWWLLDAWAAHHNLSWKTQPGFKGITATWRSPNSGTVHLIKPQTYVNLSGDSVQKIARYYQVPAARVIAVYDDLTLDVGRLKVTVRGSAGGHNGVADLLQKLGEDFARFRVGIGPKRPREMDLKDFVLARFNSEQQALLQNNLNNYITGLELVLAAGPTQAMNQLNRRNQNEPE